MWSQHHNGLLKLAVFSQRLQETSGFAKPVGLISTSLRLAALLNVKSTVLHHITSSPASAFCPHDTMLVQAGILVKWLYKSSWFWCTSFPRLILLYVTRKFGYLQK